MGGACSGAAHYVSCQHLGARAGKVPFPYGADGCSCNRARSKDGKGHPEGQLTEPSTNLRDRMGAATSVPPIVFVAIPANVRTPVPSCFAVARRVVGRSVRPPPGVFRTMVVPCGGITARVPEVIPSFVSRVLRTMLLDVRPPARTMIGLIALSGCWHGNCCKGDGKGKCSESSHGFLDCFDLSCPGLRALGWQLCGWPVAGTLAQSQSRVECPALII